MQNMAWDSSLKNWMAALGMLCVAATAQADPAYETDMETLRKSVECVDSTAPEAETNNPVLLVHGTTTNAREQSDWAYKPFLLGRGFHVCAVTYPDRGLNDMQVSAEFIAFAVNTAFEKYGRKVDMVGHSQGALVPRWSIRYWDSVREHVDDFVMLAGPQHGTIVAEPSRLGMGSEVMHQFRADSNFITTLNAGDETPGDISYTSIYTWFDELVQPQLPASTSALQCDDELRCSNFYLQDVCPGRPTDHVAIGTSDAAVAEMVVQAFLTNGALDPAAVSPDVCVATALMEQEGFAAGPGILRSSVEQGLPGPKLVTEEPPLKPYAVSNKNKKEKPAKDKDNKEKKEK